MIQSMHVRNIRSLTDARLELSDRVTLALGENGAGKSSLAGAIQYALCGWCEWTDKNGAGFADLITHGEKQASIDLATDIGVVMRTLTPKGSRLSVGERTGEDAQAMLSAKLPDRDLVAAMLSSGQFVGLPAKEQQDILFSLAGGQANAEWFAERLTAEEGEVLKDDLATRLTGSVLADALHKTAYATRTEANRQVKQLQGQASGEAVEVPADAPERAKKVARAIAKAKRELAHRQQQVGKAQGMICAHEAAKRRCEQAQQAFADVKRRREALGGEPEAPDAETVAKLQAMLIEKRAELQAATQRCWELQSEGKTLVAQIADFEGLGQGKCVLGGIECPLDAKQRAAAVAQAKGRLAQLEDDEQPTALAAEAEVKRHVEQVERDIREAEEQQARAEQWRTRRDELDREMARAGEELQAANVAYQESPAPAPETLQRNVAAAEKKVNRLEAEHRELSHILDAASAHKRVQRQLSEAKARAAMLDGLVKKLAPDGLPAQAMRETVGTVLDAVNEALGQFTDFEIKLDGTDLNVIRDGDRTALHLLSESEKLRVGAAIQVAFAKLTGFGFVVVDAADRLDSHNRGPLLRMLLKSGVQALVTATPLNGTRPSAPGLAVYDLADGRAVEARRVEEAAA